MPPLVLTWAEIKRRAENEVHPVQRQREDRAERVREVPRERREGRKSRGDRSRVEDKALSEKIYDGGRRNHLDIRPNTEGDATK